MDAVTLGKMIAKLRKKKMLTQNELAKMLNVTDKAVSKWESGMGFPEITQLPALSEIFGVSVDYMLKGSTRGIAVAGNMLVDIVNIISKFPKKNMLVDIYDVSKSVGGCVSNTIIDLAKINSELFLSAVGKIGNDDNGKYLTEELKKYGIDTSGIKISESAPTSFTSVMSEKQTGERTFFHARGANSEFSLEDVDVDALECDIFHIGYVLLLDSMDKKDDEYGTKLARLLSEVKKRGIKTSIDVISSEVDNFAETVIPSLKYCNYVIINEIEASLISGFSPRYENGELNIENVKKSMEFVLNCGVEDKVIVHCVEGGFMLNSDGTFTAVPSLKLPKGYIKGSVGAGDAFAAGCLYGIYSGFDDYRMLEFASGAAAMNLSEADAISGMKSQKEIEKLVKSLEKRSLKLG